MAVFCVGDEGHLTPARANALDADLTCDGICVDEEDPIWFASVFTQEVVRVAAHGHVECYQ